MSLKNLLVGQKELKNKVDLLEDSVNSSFEFVHGRLEDLEKNNVALEKKVDKQGEAIEFLLDKCNTLERFSRRNNFRIVGVPVEKGERCIEKVEKILREDFHLDNVAIERAHRDGRGLQGKPPHILVKMLSYRDKTSIMIKARDVLRGKDYYMVDDLTREDLKEKKKWKSHVAEAYEKGEKCRFFAGKWRGKDGQAKKFDG
ncbi:Hypp5396 [Branchiostoma lanceolatum]|nr:Hypp5396 [Branchiostoma lanceolatum]